MIPEQRQNWNRPLICSGIMLLGIFLFLFRNTHDSPWFDEIFTCILIRHDFGQIWRLTAGDVHPPLYYFLLKVFQMIFGNSLFGLRIFSAIGALALAALGMGPVRRIFGPKVGIIFSLLIVTNPMVIALSQELRMYTWAAFFLTATGLYGYLLAKTNKITDWIRFGLAGVAAAYTHYYALIAVCFINLLLFIGLMVKEKALIRRYILAAGLQVAAYVPWLISLIPRVIRKNFHLNTVYEKIAGNGWLPELSWQQLVNVLLAPYDTIFRASKALNLDLLSLAGFAFFLMAILIGWGLRRAFQKKAPGKWCLTLGIGVYVLTVLTGVAISLFFRPALIERYLFPLLGFLLVATAYGISQIPGRILTGCVIVGLMVFSTPPVINLYQYRFNGPLKEAVAYVKANLKPEDVFVHTDEHTLVIFLNAFPNHRHLLYTGSKKIQFYSNLEVYAPPAILSNQLTSFACYLKGHDSWHINRLDSPGLACQDFWLESGFFTEPRLARTFVFPRAWSNFLVYKASTGNLKGAGQ